MYRIGTEQSQNYPLSTSKHKNCAKYIYRKYRFQIRNIVSVSKNQYCPALIHGNHVVELSADEQLATASAYYRIKQELVTTRKELRSKIYGLNRKHQRLQNRYDMLVCNL